MCVNKVLMISIMKYCRDCSNLLHNKEIFFLNNLFRFDDVEINSV